MKAKQKKIAIAFRTLMIILKWRIFENAKYCVFSFFLYRSQNTSQRSVKSNMGAAENGGEKIAVQNLKPRRATEPVLFSNENQIMDSDQLPTVHNKSEEKEENCDCFSNAKSDYDNFEMANF